MIPGRLLQIKRKDLESFLETLSQCARVNPAEGESLEAVQRFKYAVGRNYETVRELLEVTERIKRGMVRDIPRWNEFQQKQHALAQKYATRAADGNIQVERQGAEEFYTYTPEAGVEMDREFEALKAEYADALAAREKNADEILAVMEQEVTVGLYVFPFAQAPRLMSGGYLAAIRAMLTGLPEEQTLQEPFAERYALVRLAPAPGPRFWQKILLTLLYVCLHKRRDELATLLCIPRRCAGAQPSGSGGGDAGGGKSDGQEGG